MQIFTKQYWLDSLSNFKKVKSVEMINDYLKMLEKADAKNILVENEKSIIGMIGEDSYAQLLNEYN